MFFAIDTSKRLCDFPYRHMFTMGYVRVRARVYAWAYVQVRRVWPMGVRTPVDGNFIMPRTVQ